MMHVQCMLWTLRYHTAFIEAVLFLNTCTLFRYTDRNFFKNYSAEPGEVLPSVDAFSLSLHVRNNYVEQFQGYCVHKVTAITQWGSLFTLRKGIV